MDFEADAKTVAVNDERLTQLSALATKQLLIEEAILTTEVRLDSLKKNLKMVSEVAIPDLMVQIGMSEFTLTNGASIKVKPFYAGRIDDENREEASAWLTENGHGALIKKTLALDFGKADGIDWKKVIADISATINEEIDVDIKLNQGVHHATLNAFIKEQIEAGNKFPLALFKAFIGNKTKITFK